MAVSGLVVKLDPEPDRARAAIGALESDPRITLGERFDNRLSIVAETEGADGDRRLWEDLVSMTGIVHVDVVFVEVDADASASCEGSPFRRECWSNQEDRNVHTNGHT